MPSISIAWKDNTNVIRVRGLADDDGNFLSDATVTVQSVVDEITGDAVSGITVPITMEYESGSDGVYKGTIPHGAAFEEFGRYTATVLAISSEGYRGQWEETLRCRVRRG